METADRLQQQYGLRPRDINVLMSVHSGTNIGYDGEVGPPGAVAYFEDLAKGRDPNVVVNWCVPDLSSSSPSYLHRIVNELVAQLARRGDSFDQNPISPSEMGHIIDLLQSNQLTNTAAKTLVRHIFNLPLTSDRASIDTLIDDLGFRASKDAGDSLRSFCEEAIKSLPIEADLVRKGNGKVLMKIVGRVMKLSKGSADAKAARALLEDMLSAHST
jgi:aspartyl-tRNA(Asn)/glutamyl-tRNA(Gln) amidotransferase subunit B